MKEEIKNLLMKSGISNNIFQVHEVEKEYQNNRYSNKFTNRANDVKYNILCIKSKSIILVWKTNDACSVCSVSKSSIDKAINNNSNYAIVGKQYSNRGSRKVFITDKNGIVKLIHEFEMEK